MCTLNLFIFLSIFGYQNKGAKYSTIILASYKKQKGFFERNKDQVILLIIGAVLGAITTYLIQLIIE